MTEEALSPPGASVLEIKDLRKSFGATQALAGASISVNSGEVHVLLGENGSGKSTLAKIVAGIHTDDGGEIFVNGEATAISDARTSRGLGIAIVFQELSLAPDLSVADNLFLGRENAAHPFAMLNRRKEREKCHDVLKRLETTIDLDASVKTLSIAQKQIVEVAKALLQQPLIMILDEPTATLTEREKDHLFAVIRRLRDEGVALLHITHHLREIQEIGDRVSVMREGEVVVTTEITPDLTELRLLELLTGRAISTEVDREAPADARPVLRIDELYTEDDCRGISLYVRPGEIVGLYGIVGCGREGVARALVGLDRPTGGSMTFEGEAFKPRSPGDALSTGVGYLPVDRKENGILPDRSIRENLNLSNLAAFARGNVISPQRERGPTLAHLAKLGVRFGSAELPITSLSGGNQQKVLFGRATGAGPRLLVLEDPTAGIDMGAKLELYEQIKAWAADGMSFLWLSSDLVETLMLCHRAYAMYDGRIVDEFINPTLDDEEAILAGVLGRDSSTPTSARAE